MEIGLLSPTTDKAGAGAGTQEVKYTVSLGPAQSCLSVRGWRCDCSALLSALVGDGNSPQRECPVWDWMLFSRGTKLQNQATTAIYRLALGATLTQYR